MSTYFSVFDCETCGHREPVGFVGELNSCPVYCTACRDRCLLCPPAGETILQTALAHSLVVPSPEATSAKKPRKKKAKQLRTWMDSGIRVPILEDLRDIGGHIFLTYAPLWESVPCPSCGRLGTLLDFRTYLQKCPRCGGNRMSESDL
jgi:hypothetical protein